MSKCTVVCENADSSGQKMWPMVTETAAFCRRWWNDKHSMFIWDESLWLFLNPVSADSCTVGSLVYSYLKSLNTNCCSWTRLIYTGSLLYLMTTACCWPLLLCCMCVWAVGWIQQMSRQEVATNSWGYQYEMINLFMQPHNTFLWSHFYSSGSSSCLKILLTTVSYLPQSYCTG